eukprot:TRINITY_DN2624_c0_g1_i3.p1 TRINITY_DN2624_c0_g1~~TRINITY_DN2624_c0_g1_i3.p1  ORF type:complete len:191 (-),score=30.85 TRINITY_DN2624_c0_g1_i3:51-623(-)
MGFDGRKLCMAASQIALLPCTVYHIVLAILDGIAYQDSSPVDTCSELRAFIVASIIHHVIGALCFLIIHITLFANEFLNKSTENNLVKTFRVGWVLAILMFFWSCATWKNLADKGSACSNVSQSLVKMCYVECYLLVVAMALSVIYVLLVFFYCRHTVKQFLFFDENDQLNATMMPARNDGESPVHQDGV